MVMLFDQYNLPNDVYDVIFATKQQAVVAKLLSVHMKENKNVVGKTEMSIFAQQLNEGELITDLEEPDEMNKKTKVSYNKKQFYDRILTPMITMGLIDYDLYKKHYTISERFNKNMMRIGLMWLQELKRPPLNYKT